MYCKKTPTSPIKIDQIRKLQQDVYQTPQIGARRFIVIDPTDRLNTAASNALLKILEEPPAHTSFILIAQYLSTIPPTIISRCQQHVFPSPLDTAHQSDYLMMGQFYSDSSGRGVLFQQTQSIVVSLCELLEEKTSISTLATKWSKFALGDVLWFLYLLTAQAIYYRSSADDSSQPWAKPLRHFSNLVEPMILFTQLDKINTLMQTIQNNITLNQTLALEALLLGYTRNLS